MIEPYMSVAVVTRDIKKSRAFYERLGFLSSGEGHWVTVWPKGANWKIHLCQSSKDETEEGNTGIALYCDDLESTFKRLRSEGITFAGEGIIKTEWGSHVMIRDPDGNEIWLMAGEP